MKQLRSIFVLLAAVVLVYACSKSSGGSDNGGGTDAFKVQLVLNYADTLILPGYSDFSAKLTTLESAVNQFLDNPTASNQQALKEPFKNAYLSFEDISVNNFGPAAALQLNNTINTFPCTIDKIESAIQTGNYDFKLLRVADSIQGLPTLDYLLFNANALTQFGGSPARRVKYVHDIFTRMKEVTANTVTQWNATYRANFVNNLQTNVGSSIGSLVNQLAFEMDMLKGPRIGYPFGKQSNNIVFADKCEGYYSGLTKELAIANLNSVKRYFTGGTGRGMDDYLVLLGKGALNTDVLAQFDVALAALQAIPAPMSAAFTGNKELVEKAYGEVQKLLTLIKTDVASATAVQITYMDNDGD